MRCLKIPDIQIIVRSGLQRSGSIAEHLCTHSHIVAVSPTSSCGVDRQNSLHGDNYSVHYKGGIVTRACNQLPPLPPPFFFSGFLFDSSKKSNNVTVLLSCLEELHFCESQLHFLLI